MSEQEWKRKEYKTWDEAFKGLIPAVRQQSVRVAAYTQVLFVQACADSFGIQTSEGAERMKGQYADLAYKCGLYHQLGKALVPPEYQLWQQDFTDEEQAVYRKYTTDGRMLVASLQEQSVRARAKRRGEWVEVPTKNIPWLMLRESCQQHMERWDGSGYPQGLPGTGISPIAQIVGLAKELDRLAAETKAETPFEEAYDTLTAQAGVFWAPELVEVLKAARSKCRSVYNKFIHYTMTLSKTISLVEKRKGRPMGLSFRPMICDAQGHVAAYEAIPWFGGIAGRPGESEPAEDVEALLHRTGLTGEISQYLLYEAADAVLRMQNCKLELKCVLRMLPGFYTQGSQLQRLHQLFKDQPIDRSRLLLTVPEQVVLEGNKSTREGIARYLKNGILLLLDNYHPDQLPPDQVKAMGFTHLRLSPELHGKQETAHLMAGLREQGFTLIGGGADSHEIISWLNACGVAFMSGTLSGVPVNEDELIRESLVRERQL